MMVNQANYTMTEINLESKQIKIRAIANPSGALSSQTFRAEWFLLKLAQQIFFGMFTIHQKK